MKNSKSTPISITIAVSLLAAMSTPSHAQVIAKPSTAGAGRGFVYPTSESNSQTTDKPPTASDNLFSERSVNLPVVAQPPKLPTVAAMPSYKTPIDTDSAINPLTGKSFSEERLTRLLNANKLVTDIARQQVAQAQLQTELELTGDRRQAESAKIRSEAINIIPKPQVSAKDSLKPGEEFVSGSSKRVSSGDFPKVVPKSEAGIQIPIAAVTQGATSGNIRIGNETIQAQSSYSGSQSRVVYVDAQGASPRPSSAQSAFGAPPPISQTPAGMSTNSGSFPTSFVPSPIQR